MRSLIFDDGMLLGSAVREGLTADPPFILPRFEKARKLNLVPARGNVTFSPAREKVTKEARFRSLGIDTVQ